MSGVEQILRHDAHVAAYASHVVRSAHVARLMEMRDEFVQIATQGRFVSAAEKEWRELPRTWRMTLLLVNLLFKATKFVLLIKNAIPCNKL